MSKRVNIFPTAVVLALSIAGCSSKPAADSKPVAVGSAVPLAVGQKARCPVTGEEFVVSASTVQVEREGKHYGFCCPDCAPTFEKDPGKFTKTATR